MLNLGIVLIFTFLVAMVLIYFISAHDRRRAKLESAKAVANDPNHAAPLDFREFNKLCMDIVEGLKLEIKDVNNVSASEFTIRATSPNPITSVEYLVACFHLPRTAELETARIIEVSDQIVSERIGKGIVMTTGKIDQHAVRALPELASMEFIDGERLMTLKNEYSFKY